MFLPFLGGIAAGAATAGAVGTTAAIGIGLSTFGTLASGVASYEQAKYNEAAAKQQAEAIRRSYVLNQRIRRLELSRLIGSQRAAMGASGFSVGSPTFQAIVRDTMEQFEIQSEIDRYNAEVRARQAEGEAALQRYRGQTELFSSFVQAGGNVFTTMRQFEKVKGTT